MHNYFTFGGFDSRDFGVFLARNGVYNAPKKDYKVVIQQVKHMEQI